MQPLVVIREKDPCPSDVPSLGILAACVKQNDDRRSLPGEIDAIPGPVENPQLEETSTQGTRIPEVAEGDGLQASQEALSALDVAQLTKPRLKWAASIAGSHRTRP
jgi:hypothetical protein